MSKPLSEELRDLREALADWWDPLIFGPVGGLLYLTLLVFMGWLAFRQRGEG